MRAKGKYTKEEFSEKYDKYSPVIYRICALQLGNRQDAEDAMQNTFIRFFYKSPVFIDENSEKAWLIRVAINVCRDFQKSFWQKKTVGLSEAAELSVGVIEDAVRLIDIFELSPKNRTVLQLYYYEGYSIAEISEILKISIGSVTSRLTRARQKLKLEMEASDNEENRVVPEH
ncbi:RNA polymerase sigma factor [Porcipelethomonas sp.]|uniref:RNA polymerase sigma factor n=1 Tax=Porcipelethomonas sp. TaxID=2981675 RepID=UPI003EF4ED8F